MEKEREEGKREERGAAKRSKRKEKLDYKCGSRAENKTNKLMLIGQKERSADEEGERGSKGRGERELATHQRHDTLPGNDNDKIN